MKILVTGANGMLGEAIRKVFKDDELYLTDIFTLDVRNYENIVAQIDKFPFVPEYILHMAAETDLEICQMIPQHAFFTNSIGTTNMTRLAKFFDIPIIYISTAGVFDGRLKRAYVEKDTPRPINVYGRSKFYGEIAVKETRKHYIFRMSWAMGGGPILDKKFVNKIYQQIRHGKQIIFAIEDFYGTPTYTHDVARTIHNHLIARAPFGIYHVAGKGKASRYDVAKAIVGILKKDIEVIPVSQNYFKQDYPCPRAINEVLDTEKLYGKCNVMRHWRNSLEEYLKEYYI